MIKAKIVRTRLGYAAFIFRENAILRMWLPGLDKNRLRSFASNHGAKIGQEDINGLAERIIGYFDGEEVSFPDRVDLSGFSAMAKSVYTCLRKVKRGRTISYGQLAQRAGRPGAARAVGSFMAKNPVPLIIPCHRVVKSDGGLGGFSGPTGVTLKEAMLELERIKR